MCMSSNIRKLFISHLLTGLVFWYGVEKLFMQHIGINATGVGIASAVYLVGNLLLDVPAGMLADRWSRKGVLVLSALSMVGCVLVLGTSHDLWQYLLGYLFYSGYIVTTGGTYQALMYDCLHEEGRSQAYSKIIGRAYALFLAGAGVANLASGFLAHHFNYRFTFFLTIVPCVLNAAILLTIREPQFHKAERKERLLTGFASSARQLWGAHSLRILAIASSVLFAVDIFKQDFGQLYMQRYVSAPEIIGILWAAYAFTWSLGSLVAHRMHKHVDALWFFTVAPLVVMSLWDSRWSLGLFMVQAVAAAALTNQLETRVQHSTSSGVRTSILSLLATGGRALAVPASLGIGWLITSYSVIVALRATTIVAIGMLLFWTLNRRKPLPAVGADV
jgi:MFS family permease